ncbi:unnamed protein product [Polarella glacialis]|nr:unnamed protein product [Polarella glacialis]
MRLTEKDVKPIVNKCPPTNGAPQKKDRESTGVVFVWILYDDPDLVLDAARLLLGAPMNFTRKALFHVDASAAISTHAAILDFTLGHYKQARKVPSFDVEWGDFSFVDAQLASMRAALDAWPGEWDTMVFLAATDMMLGSVQYFNDFFATHGGMTFLGEAGESAISKDIWEVLVNDLISSCDNLTVSLGMRHKPITMEYLESAGGNLYMGNSQQIMSVRFVRYLLSERDENAASLREVLYFGASSDETFIKTVFFNSPLCHEGISSIERDFFLYFWPLRDKTNCRRAELASLPWLCGKRPLWLRDLDATRLAFYPRTLFTRKADSHHSPELLQKVKQWIMNFERPAPQQQGAAFRLKDAGDRCMHVSLKADGTTKFQWLRECDSQASVLAAFCTGSLEQKNSRDGQGLCLRSFPAKGEADALCTIRSAHTAACLRTRGSAEFLEGTSVGFSACPSFLEGALFRFPKCSQMQLAARMAEESYGLGANRGLCVFPAKDTLELQLCNESVARKKAGQRVIFTRALNEHSEL